MKEAFERPKLKFEAGKAIVQEDYKATIDDVAILIPAGYNSDGASIPIWLQHVCGNPLSEPRVYAAVIHDWTYDAKPCSRSKADAIYRKLSFEFGVPVYAVLIEHFFIRIFGAKHWQASHL